MASKKKKPAVTADEAQKSRGKKTVKVAEFATLMKTTRQCVYQWIDRGCPYRNGPEGKEIPLADGIEYLVVTRWQSLDAIRRFAGADPEAAVVPPIVQQLMVDFDHRAAHYEVVGS